MTKAAKLTSVQISLVKRSWSKLLPIADVAAALFYDRLFEINPELRPMFKTQDLTSQRKKLAKAITTVIMSLENIETLMPMIRLLGQRHVAYGVEDAHYDQVGEALLWALEAGLGNDWNDAIRQSWINAYQLLSSVMINAAREGTSDAA
jgi:hemoglobin-like flavoprotein